MLGKHSATELTLQTPIEGYFELAPVPGRVCANMVSPLYAESKGVGTPCHFPRDTIPQQHTQEWYPG